jgi:autophagy-related protein 33
VLISIALERLRLSGVEYGITSTQTLKVLQGGGAGGEIDEEVNGEVIKDGIDQYQHWVLIRGGIIGSGFLMSLVGLYGDHK